MDNKYTWKTEDIFATDKDWEDAFVKAGKDISFKKYKGKLNNIDCFLECMKKEETLSRAIDRLYVYASMKRDVDTRNSFYDSMLNKIMGLASRCSAETSFITPELTKLDSKILNDYISNPILKDYDYLLKGIAKAKEHILSNESEKMMADLGETFASFRDIFSKFNNADLPLKDIKHKGQKYPLTHGTYGVYMHGEDRELRKKVFNKYYDAFIENVNHISATYYGNVKKNVFSAKTRKYNSVLEMALSSEDVEKEVYDNLISSVHEALPLLHDYMAYKKEQLGLEKMHMYDIYVPTESEQEIKLDYDKAYDLVIEGLAPLGKDYQELLKKAKEERWIDVYETAGKRSGAYSTCVYDTHPYVLLNYQQTTHDVFTIAHEMGHSIHSYFSNKAQPYYKADYKIFVAEIASTVNEVLLVKYLISKADSKEMKKFLLTYLLEMIRTTLFRQTQFAEFEYLAHKKAFKGEPLTKDNLSDIYYKLNKKYYGKAVVSDKKIKYEWMRIPHFYTAFYVYKYATGIISALSICDRILTEGESAVKDYFKFLEGGNSNSPIELLKIAGVDLTKKDAFLKAFKVVSDTLEQVKTLG